MRTATHADSANSLLDLAFAGKTVGLSLRVHECSVDLLGTVLRPVVGPWSIEAAGETAEAEAKPMQGEAGGPQCVSAVDAMYVVGI